jgi:hypothetical protein
MERRPQCHILFDREPPRRGENPVAGKLALDPALQASRSWSRLADEKSQMVRLRNIENLADEELKGKLVVCTQLTNIRSGRFMTEGHFWLSR